MMEGNDRYGVTNRSVSFPSQSTQTHAFLKEQRSKDMQLKAACLGTITMLIASSMWKGAAEVTAESRWMQTDAQCGQGGPSLQLPIS